MSVDGLLTYLYSNSAARSRELNSIGHEITHHRCHLEIDFVGREEEQGDIIVGGQ